MFVYFSVANENIANHIQKCSFGGRRVFVLTRKMCIWRSSSLFAYAWFDSEAILSLWNFVFPGQKCAFGVQRRFSVSMWNLGSGLAELQNRWFPNKLLLRNDGIWALGCLSSRIVNSSISCYYDFMESGLLGWLGTRIVNSLIRRYYK